MKVERVETDKASCDEVTIQKEYKTISGFLRGVKAAFDAVYGGKGFGEDELTVQLGKWNNRTLEEVIRQDGFASYNADGLGYEIRYPDFIYVYLWTLKEVER